MVGTMTAAHRRNSERVSAITESATLAVDAKAKAIKAAGLPPVDGFDGSATGNYTSPIGGGSVDGPRAPAWPDGASIRTAVDGGAAIRHGRIHHRAVAQLARVPVSKTGGWGFESLLPCEHGPRLAGLLHR